MNIEGLEYLVGRIAQLENVFKVFLDKPQDNTQGGLLFLRLFKNEVALYVFGGELSAIEKTINEVNDTCYACDAHITLLYVPITRLFPRRTYSEIN